MLLTGETDTGKTHLARLLHQLSPRHTGATEARPGFFEAADGGTLFLDEIGELPLALQPKLLSALEDGQVRRVGSPREIRVDVRVLAATHRDLESCIQRREFRADLFYRFGKLQHRLPPLRERGCELPGIIAHLLRGLAAEGILSNDALPDLHPDALRLLRNYSWPGNVRELKDVLACAANVIPGPVLLPEHVAEYLAEPVRSAPAADFACGEKAGARKERSLPPACPHQEKQRIIEALAAEGGNRTRAAKRLGMSRQTFWIRMKQYGIQTEER